MLNVSNWPREYHRTTHGLYQIPVSAVNGEMSGLGQLETFPGLFGMSAAGGRADIIRSKADVQGRGSAGFETETDQPGTAGPVQ